LLHPWHRWPLLVHPVPTPSTTGTVNYDFTGINQGWIDTEGWDLGVNYRLPEFAFGRFAVHWSTTYTSHLNTKTADDAEFESPGTSFAGNFRIRSNASLDWSLGDFGATWGMRYYSSQKEACSYDKAGGPECNMPNYTAPDVGPGAYPLNRVGALTFHDVSARWSAVERDGVRGRERRVRQALPMMYSARTRSSSPTAVGTSVASTTCVTRRSSSLKRFGCNSNGPATGPFFC
jgi:hypothetical protein